jgi:single-stranded-DNA-specific exonuclease
MASRRPADTFVLEPYAYAEAQALAEALELPEPVAVTLVRRGFRTVEQAREFLTADELHDPMGFEGMAEAVERVRAAVAAGARITVHGDYDVDGVCATAILVGALRELGAQADWLIPDRMGEGYGLTMGGVERLAAGGTGLLVTVDCGIGCAAEVAAARRAGIEVIVTDHHQPGDQTPDCPVLHPALSGYECQELCGTGVAYKLSAALRGEEGAAHDLDLVALATVADMVPLRGENRVLVRRGLAEARRARRPGLRALMASARVDPAALDEGDLAFRLAPRINAAGRLYRADAGVELMLTDDEARAAAIAGELDDANHERRRTEQQVLGAAESSRARLPQELAEAPALVLAGEGWHPGVVGIVASRLVERHGRPVVLIGLDGSGGGRGSGRSIPGFDLLAGLHACGEHLTRFGGHRAAAGLEIEAGRVDAFREAFVAHASSVLQPSDLLRSQRVDAVVGGESLGLDVAEQFARLAPFGMGNPSVRLLVPSARIHDVRRMGEGDRHARFRLHSGGRHAQGVAFGVNGELDAAAREPHDVSVGLELNQWNGAIEPRVVLGDLFEADASPCEPGEPSDEDWWERVDRERAVDLDEWPPSEHRAQSGPGRAVNDRRRASGVATVAALASTGEAVLVLCCDALRRRELVERAAVPARFGGGRVALAPSGACRRRAAAAIDAVLEGSSGVVLADWAYLEHHPGLPARFAHVVLVDPPPFAHLEALAQTGSGHLHLAWSGGDAELALRVHESHWPVRSTLAIVYRALGGEEGASDAAGLRARLAGPGAHPRSPEVAGRCLRVLEELELVRWEGSSTARALGVVSSGQAHLGRSQAYAAYEMRFEEGRRYLSRPGQPS